MSIARNDIDFLNYERDVLIYMFRYCLGRKTYAVSTAVEIIWYNWNRLYTRDRALIHKEILEHFQMYEVKPNDIDYKEWSKILKLSVQGDINDKDK